MSTDVSADIVTTSGTERVSQIMAQVALQPGLEAVLSDLLEYEDGTKQGAEFYLTPCSQLEGG